MPRSGLTEFFGHSKRNKQNETNKRTHKATFWCCSALQNSSITKMFSLVCYFRISHKKNTLYILFNICSITYWLTDWMPLLSLYNMLYQYQYRYAQKDLYKYAYQYKYTADWLRVLNNINTDTSLNIHTNTDTNTCLNYPLKIWSILPSSAPVGQLGHDGSKSSFTVLWLNIFMKMDKSMSKILTKLLL